MVEGTKRERERSSGDNWQMFVEQMNCVFLLLGPLNSSRLREVYAKPTRTARVAFTGPRC